MRKLQSVATRNGHGKQIKPHEIVSGDRLDAGDMAHFQTVLQAKLRAVNAANAAQVIEGAFWETIAPKYKLERTDNITADGTIIRNPMAEAVKT